MKKVLSLLFAAVFLLAIPAAAQAYSLESSDNIYVGKNETIEGNLYAAGQSITVDGIVSGDIIGAAQTITVNGIVNGDIIGAAQTINLNGEVKGNVRAAANSLNINGYIGKNLNAFGAVLILSQNSKVSWDALVFANTAEIRGTIEGSLHGEVSVATIAGKIGHDVDLKVEGQKGRQSLMIDKEAVIAGDLNYTSLNDANIQSASSIAGQTNKTLPEKNSFDWGAFLWLKILSIFAALLVSFVLWFLWKSGIEKNLAKIKNKWGLSLLNGLVILGVIIISCIILAITIIGLPLAMILAVLGAILFYLGKIIAAIFVGNLIISFFTKKKFPVAGIVLGIILVWFLCSIPFVGWLICFAAAILGGGALAETLKEKLV